MDIRKGLLLITLLIICSLILTGCGNTTTETIELDPGRPEVHGLVQIGEIQQFRKQFYQCMMYDPETKVLYSLIVYNAQGQGGITLSPLYNADGTLRLYEPSAQ